MKRGDSTYEPANDDADPRQPAYWLEELRSEVLALGIEWSKSEQWLRGKQALWLATYVRSASKTLAHGASRVSSRIVKGWMEDPIFAPLVPMAAEALSDVLASEARRRAVDGVSISVRDRFGNVIGEERKYSDQMLMFLLKGLDKERRWAQKVDLSGVEDERWRKALLGFAEDPDMLDLLDRIADKAAAAQEPNEG
jgi:hypothetical protein